MFEHIHIQTSDTFGSIRVVWPDGTIHSHSLPKGVGTHRVVHVLADALSEHVYPEPVGDSAVQPEAGGLQYALEVVRGFCLRQGASMFWGGQCFTLLDDNGDVIVEANNLPNLSNYIKDHYHESDYR